MLLMGIDHAHSPQFKNRMMPMLYWHTDRVTHYTLHGTNMPRLCMHAYSHRLFHSLMFEPDEGYIGLYIHGMECKQFMLRTWEVGTPSRDWEWMVVRAAERGENVSGVSVTKAGGCGPLWCNTLNTKLSRSLWRQAYIYSQWVCVLMVS